jgi:GT2 family glycosyltransferase
MKPLIIIAGMHRSGTSFLARCLNLSGVYLGDVKSLMSHEWEFLKDNPRGHWENKEILKLTEKTLSENNGNWDNIPSDIKINETLGQEITNYLEQLEKEPSIAFGFKDPRIIPCFNSWKEYLPSNLIVIGIFRHPLKVAESLKKRNGFEYEKSIKLWEIYNTELLKIIENHNGFLINFDLPKEEIFSEIKFIIKKLELIDSTKFNDWFDEKLLQSNQTFESNFKINENVKSIYSKLLQKSKMNDMINVKISGKTNSDYKEVIASMLSQLYDQSKNFRNKVDQYETELTTKKKTIDNLQKDFEEKAKWAQNLDSENKTKDETIKKIQKDFEELNQKLTSNENKIKLQNEEIDQLQNKLSTEESQLEDIYDRFYENKHELNQIKNSISFRVIKKFTNFIDWSFPPQTRRGEWIRLLKMALLTYKNEGYEGLSLASKQKFSSIKLTTTTKPFAESKIILSDTDFVNGVFLPAKDKFSIEPNLRKFLNYNFGNFKLTSYPKVSIIILTYDQTLLLKKNIESIKNKTTYSNYEIIVITNNTDKNSDMWKLLKKLDCRSYLYDDEYSFSKMNNFGASKADGEFLIILNDDTEIVSNNWIESFLRLAEDESVGAIGAKLLFTDGLLQEAGCIFWKNGNAWNYGRGKNQDSPEFNYVRNVDYCSGSCLFVRKKIFDKIGGFDPNYHPAYAEDAELCFSIRQEGYQVLYQPMSVIIHHEGSTQGTKTTQGIKSYQIRNMQKFSQKWKNVLDTYREDSIPNSFFERNRKNGLNILIVDHYIPEPDKDSGSLRTFRLLGILSHLNHKVTFWPDNLRKTQPYALELQQKGIEVISGSNNFKNFLDERSNLYDVAIISRPHIAPKYIDQIKEKLPKCIIIYDTVDLHFLRMTRQFEQDQNASKSEIDTIQDTELALMNKSDITVLTSEDEAKFLHSTHPDFRFVLLPNIHIFEGKVPNFTSRENLMFIGNFQHPPNLDAASFLLDEIFPKIQQKLPNVKLYIIGPNPPDSIKKHESEFIHVLGYVKNIDEYFTKCKVNISPIRFGAGIKGKITQSLTRGLPVVTTTMGSEGIGLTDSISCMIADDAQSLADKVCHLYNDSSLWNKISSNGLQISQRYSAENIKNIIESLISKIDSR